MYEKAEGTKGRKIRLSIAENLSNDPGVDARSKRLWFLACLLKNMEIDKHSGKMNISFNPVSEKLEIECNNFRSRDEMINSFLKVLSAIPVLENLHYGLSSTNLEKFESPFEFPLWGKKL